MPEVDDKASVQVRDGQAKPSSSRAKWWISELISLAVVLAAVTAARSSLADHYYVPSGSMQYSLMDHDRVIVNKMSYGLRIPLTKIDLFGSSTPTRGDIAVFDSPEDGKTRLIKRIVAIGGDRVSVVNGQLSINGQPLGDRQVERFGERDALLNLTSQPSYNQGGGPNFEGVVPPGMVLAMGDNRGNSNDGRKFGFIDERELFGRAVAIYYRRGDGFTWKPL
jgi:signal peptidase I